jgi:putative CocE/NonD family hydrolase
MRDGVQLASNIYRLDGVEPQPVILARTPYDKDMIVNGDDTINLLRMVQAGYSVVIQDTRGRFASEGKFNAMVQERHDGADTIEWIATQPWSNGLVGTFGGSYVGNTQWMAALEQPQALRAIAPLVTWSDLYEGMLYMGGVNVLHGLVWSAAMAIEEIRRRVARGEISQEASTTLVAALSDVNAILAHLPLDDHPPMRELVTHYIDWINHPMPGAYWQPTSPSTSYTRVTTPALNIGGWYDCFLWGTLQNYIGMKQNGGNSTARQNQRLIIGPWTHGGFTGCYPERDFGVASSALACDLAGTHLRWYDHWLKGIENGVEQEKPVKIFVMGLDQWREEQDWPLPDAHARCYYLHSLGQANTLRGDGVLSTESPANEPADIYLYNPRRPVPTMGGQVLIVGSNTMGPRDQREVETRDDVLVYSTPVLEKELEVTGPITLRLFIASSARDTDFTGKLVDVFPDGKAIILTEGAFQARYHQSMIAPEQLISDRIYELSIDLWATSNVFLTGHRIRLEISSSNFPKLARNTNTGGIIASENLEQCVPAVNRIFHDREHPSHLILPIIERD